MREKENKETKKNGNMHEKTKDKGSEMSEKKNE